MINTKVLDFEAELKNFQGQTLVYAGDQGQPVAMTLKYVAVSALLTTENPRLPAAEKFTRYQLAKRIYDQGVLTLEGSEIQKLKQVIGEACQPLIVGIAYGLLDAEPAPEVLEAKEAVEALPMIADPVLEVPAEEKPAPKWKRRGFDSFGGGYKE